MTPDQLILAADAWLHVEDLADGEYAGQFDSWQEALRNWLDDSCNPQMQLEILVAYEETTDDPGEAKEHWEYEYKTGDSWYREIGRMRVMLTLEVES